MNAHSSPCQSLNLDETSRAALLRTVYIVDDSDVIRQHLSTLIQKIPGARVVGEAALAFDAIRGIRRLRPHVVVLDISMPGGSGFEVLECIQSDSHRPTIVVLTNFAHDRYRARCLELGADYFYDKLDEFDQVPALIGRMTARSDRGSHRAPVAA